MLDRLADVQAEAGDPLSAIRTWQDVMARHPVAAERMRIDDKIATAFEDALSGPPDRPLTPVRALALVEDLPHLLPRDEEGRRLRRALGERLAQVDLVEPAIDLIAEPTADSVDGTLLASLHLRAADPQAALDALERSTGDTSSDQMRRKRAQLRAAALRDLDRLDDALTAIDGLDDPASSDVRLEILWRQGGWAALADALERRLAAADPTAGPLGPQEQAQVVQLAIAHARSGADGDLADLRTRFAEAMAGTAMEPDFLLASAPRQPAPTPAALLAMAGTQIESVRALLSR